MVTTVAMMMIVINGLLVMLYSGWIIGKEIVGKDLVRLVDSVVYMSG